MAVKTMGRTLSTLLIGATLVTAEELPDFDKLWNYGDPAGTEEKFRAILPRAKEPGNADYHLQLLTQIARTQSLRGQFAEAHKTLDEVEGKLTDETKPARLRYLLERGRSFNSAGEGEKALALFKQAFEFGTKLGEDYHAIDAAHMIAIAVATVDEKLAWGRKGIDLAGKTKDKRAAGWKGALLNNVGYTLLEAKRFDEARATFTDLVTYEKGRQNARGESIAKWFLGHILRKEGKHEEALAAQRDLLKQAEKEGRENTGFTHEEIAECLYALGKKDEAKPHFKKAFDLLNKIAWVKADKKRMERLARLAG